MLIRAILKLVLAAMFFSLLSLGISHSQTIFLNSVTTVRNKLADSGKLMNHCSSNTPLGPETGCEDSDLSVSRELSALGVHGALIAQVRQETLEILQTDNTCSAWFQEADPTGADVFRSLHYYVDANGTADIHSIRDKFGDLYLMHPWGARSREYSGKDSFILINGNGPFFNSRSRVVPADPREATRSEIGLIPVLIGPYTGATAEAQITIMLHELGHITGRLPVDDNSWDGSSSRNTSEVLRHCKKEIHQTARKARNGMFNDQVQVNSRGGMDRLEAATGQ